MDNQPTPPRLLTVDPALGAIITHVESSGFSGALRFEPAVYATIKGLTGGPSDPTPGTDLVKTIAKFNLCTIETGEVLYSTSFGLYQIMGYNLYRLGLHRPLSEYLAGPNARILQDAMFAKFLADRNINFTWAEMLADQEKLNVFAERYNGSLAYGNRMKAIAKEIGKSA